MITVGTDTYATLAEATIYIEKYFLSTAAKRTAWEALDEADQEVRMRQATQQVESCKYRGIKTDGDQALEFPRYFYRDDLRIYYDWDYTHEVPIVPDAVKNSQIEEALELTIPGTDTENKELRTGPVKSFRVGRLAETYGSNGTINPAALVMNSSTAAKLLEPYTNGGFQIS